MTISELKELTCRLASINGVSGDESAAAEFCKEFLEKYTTDVEIKNGNVIAHIGKRQAKPHIMLDAHLDRVGMIAVDFKDSFVKASPVGGLDFRILPAQRVIIHGKEDVTGVVCTLPPHLSKEKKVMSADELWIDTGLDDPESIISKGDLISYDSPCRPLLGERVCGGGLDDRAGAAVILDTVDILSESGCSFTVLLSAQEEIGERGACIGGYEINPDIAIEFDVSFALCGGEKASKCGRLGEGGMIGFSPSLDRELSLKLKNIAAEKNIPCQNEVMNALTGTNADRFTVTREGIRAATVSIPLRYMHTPAEVVDINDIKACAELAAEFIRGGQYGA